MRRGLHGCAVATSIAIVVPGCVREAEDFICPDVDPGDLVVTELRGPQASPNSLPQWIEIANVSGDSVDLQGLHLDLQRQNGDGPLDMIVRYKRTIAADGYYVLGFVSDTMLESGVDYGLAGEHDGDLYDSGVLALVACGEEIDKVVYDALPDMGTWSLGLAPPAADGNDAEDAWCVDATIPDGPMTELGIPGTPGEANRPCE
jgi:hypothetical protein